MYQQFYYNNLQSNFIKYLLQNTYIPTVPFTCNINHVTKDCIYIHEKQFVKALQSQDLAQIRKDIKENSSNYFNYFHNIEPYIFGNFYNGLTTNYISKSNFYDPEVHFYLGQYLKAYKAYYGINLFPYYNCFSDEYFNYISLKSSETFPFVTIGDKFDANYKILSVPISLCQEYTIAIDCPQEVLMTPVFIDKNGILEEQTNILKASLAASSHPNLHKKSNYIFRNLKFNSPVYFFSPCIPGIYDKGQLSLPQYEKYLRLLIRVPTHITSSIVILQGHYSNVKNYQDKKINLDINSVKKHLKEFKEIDYTHNSINTLKNNSILTHYGSLDTILQTYPECIVGDNHNVDLIKDKSDNKSVLNNISLIKDKNNNNSILNLEWKQTESLSKESYLPYPLETPILGSNLTEVNQNLENIIQYLENKDRYIISKGDSGNYYIQPDYIFKINGVLKPYEDKSWNHTLSIGDTVQIKLLGGTYNINIEDNNTIIYSCYDSEWSDPLIIGNDNNIINNNIKYFTKLNLNSILNNNIFQIKCINEDNDNDYLNSLNIEIDNQSLKDLIPKNLQEWSLPIYYNKDKDIIFHILKGTKLIITTYSNIIFIEPDNIGNNMKIYVKDISLKDLEITGDSNYLTHEDKTTYQTIKLQKDIKASFSYSNWVQLEWLNGENSKIPEYLDNYMYNNLSLLNINDQVSYAFTSRLFEYLVNNVITDKDIFYKNIKRIQGKLKIPNTRYWENISLDGIWNDFIRVQAFELSNEYMDKLNYNRIKDTNGFIDKDTENIINNLN